MFEGINIEDLENSDEGILDGTGLSLEDTSPDKKGDDKKETTDDDDIELSSNDGINIEDLAGLGEEDDAENDIVDKNRTPDKGKVTKNNSSSQDTFTLLASALSEAGVFSSIEKEDIENIKNVDGLLNAIAKQIKQNELTDLNEDQKKYVEAIRNGVEHDTYHNSQQIIKQYKAVDDDKIEANSKLQFELIKRSYLIEGISQDKADKLAKASLTDEDVVDQAIEARNALIAFEESKIQDQIKAKEEEKQKKIDDEAKTLAELKSKIYESSEIISGIKINTQTKDKIYNSLTSPVNVKNGKYLNDVMESYNDPEYKMRLHTMHVLTNGFKDFSKFSQTNKSKAVLELEKKLQEQGIKNGNSPIIPSMGATGKSIKDALDQITF